MMATVERLSPHLIDFRVRNGADPPAPTWIACVTVGLVLYARRHHEAMFSVEGESPTGALMAALAAAESWIQAQARDEEPADRKVT